MHVDVLDWRSSPGFRDEMEQRHMRDLETTDYRDWSRVRLGDVIEVNPKRSIPKGQPAPFISMADISENRRTVLPTKTREYKSGARFYNDDTLLARITPCLENGKTAWVTSLPERETAHGSTEFIVLSGKAEVTDPLFVYYLARSPRFRAYAISQMTGTSGRQRVPTVAVKNYRFFLPPISDQRYIARVLGALDDKIELNRRMCETLEEMTRALFRSWFVDFDPVRAKIEGHWRLGESLPGLPAHLHDLFPDRLVPSRLGDVPEGWQVTELGEVVDVVGGSTPSTKIEDYWFPAKHCWATPKDLARLSSSVLIDTNRRISDAGLARISSGLLPVGTLLLSSRAPIGYLAISEVPVAINQGFIAMPPSDRISNLFLLSWCRAFRDEIIRHANGSTFLEVSKSAFRRIVFLRPSMTVIDVFDAHVRTLYRQAISAVSEARTLVEKRDTLLPKLISGEVGIRDADEIAADDIR